MERRRIPRIARTLSACSALSALALLLACGEARGAGSLVLTYEHVSPPTRETRLLCASTGTPNEIDGKLDDGCWPPGKSQELASDMPGGTVFRSTSVRLCYDDRALYAAFQCREPAMGDIPLSETPTHDVRGAENAQLCLAAGSGLSDFFLLSVDPNGNRSDWSKREGAAWSPEWKAATVRTADGWTAEIALPFASLGVDHAPTGTIWRLNFRRDAAVTGEQCAWQPALGSLQNPDIWGRLFFGTAVEYQAAPRPPAIHLYPERWVIRPRDRTLRAVVKVSAGSETLQEMELVIGLDSPDGQRPATLPRPSRIALQREGLELVLNTEAIPAGESLLYAELRSKGGMTLGRAQAPLTRQSRAESSAPPPVKITVPAYEVAASAASAWPITTGVALPQGALRSPESIRLLNDRRQEIPVTGQVRGRWPGDGSIRWLGLDFQADLRRGQPQTFTLEYGPDVKPTAVRGFKHGLLALRMDIVEDARVTDFEGAWWVNTGTLLFTVNHERFSGVTEAWVDVDGNGQYDWFEQILNARGGLAGPYLVDAGGRTYRLSADRDVKITLEEWSPLRAVLRVEGRLLPESGRGRDMGRCVMQISAYIGHPFLKVETTFFLNESAARAPLRDIGIEEYLDAEFSKRFLAAFGAGDAATVNIKDTGLIYLMKLAPDKYVLQSEGKTALDQRGEDAGNWGAAGAGNRGLAMIMRDMDTLRPKAIAIRPDRHMIAHFWPPYGKAEERALPREINRFTAGALDFASTGLTFDLQVPHAFSDGLKDQDGLKDFSAVQHAYLADPTGVALSYETLYMFLNGPLNVRELTEIDKVFQLRPHAVQDLASLAASGALRETLPPERSRKALDMVGRLLALEKRYPASGDVDDMDLRRQWLPDENRWALNGYWMGTRCDLPLALWTLYLQTGDASVFSAAERNTRHAWCFDVCHEATPAQITRADPRRRKIPGAFGNHNTPIHWFNTCSVSDRRARIGAFLMAYYLTGDAIPLETALLWADAAGKYGQASAGADGLAFLTNLDEMLFLRHDPLVLERRGDCAEHFFNMPIGGNLVEWMPGLRAYLRQTGDPRVRPYLRTAADNFNVEEDRPDLLGVLRDLYAVTGEEEYLTRSDELLTGIERRMEQPDFSWQDFCGYVFHGGQAADPAAAE